MNKNINRHRIISIWVDQTSYVDVIDRILNWQTESAGIYVCVANVHMCMEAFDSIEICQIVNNADLVVPDGMPIVWGLKALGEKQATQVRGSDLMFRLCSEAQKQNIPTGLFGGMPDSLNDLFKFLKKEFPSLKIPFYSSPPFRTLTQKEKDKYVKEINASGAKILFVGLGCPKQEKWMAEHRDKLSCVMIGVGAAFDFFSGKKKPAPRWMQKAGLEWLFRFSNEPIRLWRRYLKHNPRFVWYFLKQFISKNN